MRISYKLQMFPFFFFKLFIQLNITYPATVFQELPIKNNYVITNCRQMFLALCWKANKKPSLPHLHFLFLLKSHPFLSLHLLHYWIHLTRSLDTWCVLLFLLFQCYCALFCHLCLVFFWTLAMAEKQGCV